MAAGARVGVGVRDVGGLLRGARVGENAGDWGSMGDGCGVFDLGGHVFGGEAP